eukprot:TRINITY_DN5257_c0_g1_i1.p1 TRINITY_DN5257_c0_g1~~TRINITY_DN5257_c0_g1_i1.p1  ORF type:complete len:369 (+),score=77.44 TRINITY_DN5257_c0_g1_i1:214-1320(+)
MTIAFNNKNATIVQIGDWRLGTTIGTGTYGVVRKCKNAVTNQIAAVKIVDLTSLKETERKSLHREIMLHTMLHHPNITQVYEVTETDDTVFIFMELLEGGDLHTYISSQTKPLSEPKVQRLFWQLLSALIHCHQNNVAHRDFKLENILLSKDYSTVKITDFGLSNHFEGDQLLTTSCGSPNYAAPEVLQNRFYSGSLADLWSLGVTLYAMLTHQLPFINARGNFLLSRALRGLDERNLPLGISKEASEVLLMLLQAKPEHRASPSDLLSHPWVRKAKALYVEQVAREQQQSLLKIVERKSLGRFSRRSQSVTTPNPNDTVLQPLMPSVSSPLPGVAKQSGLIASPSEDKGKKSFWKTLLFNFKLPKML